jgi:hypothetical protein
MEEYINSDTSNQQNVRFVTFRNIMMPVGNIHNFQKDYNNTDIKIELMDEKNQLLDNSYETNIIQNTVDTISKVNNLKMDNHSITKDETGKYVYNQEIPMTSSINNIAQRLFTEIKKSTEFKHITIEDIRNLIFKRNIREWNSSIIKGFVKELRAFSNQKSIFMKNVHAHQHPQITQLQQINYEKTHDKQFIINNQPNSQKNLNNSFENLQDKLNVTRVQSNQFQTKLQNTQISQTQTPPQPQTQTQTTLLTICSDDRNAELYPSAYDFKMVFENKNDNIERIPGTIYQNINNISNIINIQVNSVIIPSSPELENLPYLLLEIEELGGVGSGSNEWFDKCIGKLFFQKKLGKYHIHTDKFSIIEKQFKIPINLNNITIRLRKPNGEIWKDTTDLSLTIELKITIRKLPINPINHINHINPINPINLIN